MEATERGGRRELFASISDDGTRWTFVIEPDNRWAITQNGKCVATGTADRKSIQAGVGKYTGLTHGVAGTSPRDGVLQRHLQLNGAQIKPRRAAAAGGTAK
jgi:hypothetical protein